MGATDSDDEEKEAVQAAAAKDSQLNVGWEVLLFVVVAGKQGQTAGGSS